MEARVLDLASEMLKFEFLCAPEQPADYLAPFTPETLHKVVAERVALLLEKDFSRLLSSLYQIDVEEELVQAAFRLPSREQTASQIALLIIDREISKARSRTEHRFS